jgi:hypothetical protein
MSIEAVWTTKAGQVLNLRDMSDLHLTNTIAMMVRKLDAAEAAHHAAYSWSPSGDMASYYAEGAQADAGNRMASIARKLHLLRAEAARRGIK